MQLIFFVVLVALRFVSGEVSYDPAVWNAATLLKASNVPGRFFQPNRDNDAVAWEQPLVPIIGFNVVTQCQGPNTPVNFSQAAAGTCAYAPNPDGTYTYTEKQQGERMRLANCYCYAVDRFAGGWCYPGLGGGKGELVQDQMNCSMLSERTIADGGVAVDRATAMAGQPAKGHYIALMYRSMAGCQQQARCSPDFHYLRKDSNGRWSQKVGEAPVTDKDRAGNQITDPEVVAKDGGYDQFCGYFSIEPAAAKVGTIAIPDGVTLGLTRWKNAGIQYVQEATYVEGVDGVDYYAQMEKAYAAQRSGDQQQQKQAPAVNAMAGSTQQQQPNSKDVAAAVPKAANAKAANAKAANATAANAKATNAKAANAKPIPKPAPVKPAPKPAQAKPAPKPAQEKPAAVKPAAKPAPVKPAPKPAQEKPAPKPVQAQSVPKPATQQATNALPRRLSPPAPSAEQQPQAPSPLLRGAQQEQQDQQQQQLDQQEQEQPQPTPPPSEQSQEERGAMPFGRQQSPPTPLAQQQEEQGQHQQGPPFGQQQAAAAQQQQQQVSQQPLAGFRLPLGSEVIARAVADSRVATQLRLLNTQFGRVGGRKLLRGL